MAESNAEILKGGGGSYAASQLEGALRFALLRGNMVTVRSAIRSNSTMGDDLPDLGELEREVMGLVWGHAPISAELVRERLPRRLKESTVRTELRRLEEKGYVSHSIQGRTYLFQARDERQKVAAKAVRRIADWFCNGSLEEVLVGIVDAKMLDDKELEQLSKKIEAAKRRRK
jgi:BlaI family transcriptional regulator, penicillinase repressor